MKQAEISRKQLRPQVVIPKEEKEEEARGPRGRAHMTYVKMWDFWTPLVTVPLTKPIRTIVCFEPTPSPLSADVICEWPPAREVAIKLASQAGSERASGPKLVRQTAAQRSGLDCF